MELQLAMHLLDKNQLTQWQSLLEERTGIFLPEKRYSFLQAQLNMRMREIGYDDYQEYFDHIRDGSLGAIEWLTLVDRLTVQETRFFRDPDALELVEQILKDAAKNPHTASFEAWSVGCSSGQEAYSLAMLAEHHFASANKRYAITGTDISIPVLRKAQQGIYSKRSLMFVPPQYIAQSFDEIGDQQVQIKASMRKRCCFTQVNILDLASYPLHSQHLIYCQNVLIYFRRWRRKQILNDLVERLAPGGLLIIGLGEMVDFQHPLLEPIANSKVSAFIRKNNINMESAGR